MIAIGFVWTFRISIAGGLLVDRPRTLDVARAVARHHLLHARADHVRMRADAAGTADLEERKDDVVVTRVQVEPAVDDVARRIEARLRLLHRRHVLDLGQPRDRRGLGVHDDARRDVVEDDGRSVDAAIASTWATMARCGGRL